LIFYWFYSLSNTLKVGINQLNAQHVWHYQIKQKMGCQDNCWDNAPMERFFRRLKIELISTLAYRNFIGTRQSITQYLVDYYSQRKPHQHNRGLSPNAAK
jgi:putative transposase